MKYLILCAIFGLACAIPAYPYERRAVIDITPDDLKKYFVAKQPVQLNSEQTKTLQNSLKNLNGNNTEVLKAIVNEFMDKIVFNADEMLKNKNYDPMALPGVHKEETVNIIWLIPYTVSFDLYDGKIVGSSSIFRRTDAVISYDESSKYLSANVPVSFKSLHFEYYFKGVVPLVYWTSGMAEGGLTDLDMNIAVGMNIDTGLITLDDYSITNSGHIDLGFHTFGLTPDWMINLALNTFTAILKDEILSLVQGMVKGTMSNAINLLNSIIQGL